MRQLRSLFLLIAFWGLFATEALAYDFQATSDDGITFFYNWIKDKTEVAITHEGKTWVATEGYTGDIKVPESVTYEGKTYPVTRIGYCAFFNCEITSITIPRCVNTIGEGALGECIHLTSLFIPNTVTKIGDNAFQNCIGLTSIVVEDGNPNYDSRNNCNAVIETATNTLLRGCRNTVIPDDIEAFGSLSMSNLKTFTIQTLPRTVKYIGEYAFLNCESITSLTIPGSVKTIETMAFNGCVGMTELTIEKGVETIAGSVFQSCLGLTVLTLPVTIQSLGKNLIFDSINIKTIKVLFGQPIPIDGSTFNTFFSPSTMTLYVPKGCREAFATADYWNEFGQIIETDEEAEPLEYFYSYINDTKMYFKILDHENKTVQIGLGDEPAIDTSVSGELVLPSEVKGYTVIGIASNAFAGCASLTEVTIPASITSIASGAFSGNTELTKVTYEGSPCPIASDAFDAYTYNHAALVVDDDKKEEFANTQGWKEFISLTVDLFIGDTFTDTTVEGIEVTYTVTSVSPRTVKVGIDALHVGVPSGTSGVITIPSSVKGYQVTAIASGAFASRSKVTEVILPPTITTLEDYAFGNTSLKYVTLPASVQSIGTDIFYYSNSITYVRVLSTTPIAIKEDAFPKRSKITLYVPYGSKEAYQTAAYWKEFKEIVELPEDDSDILMPGTTFTSPTVEGVDVLYTVTSIMPNTVKVASKSVDKGTSGSVTIPSNVNGYVVIGVSANAFQDASKVSQIILPSTVTTLDERAFYFCYAKEINIPTGVTVIPEETFRYADITRITIPTSVQTIGSNAFYKCDDLAFVFMESATPIGIPENAFPTRANVALYVPYGSKEAYEAADYWKEFKEIRELPEDMTDILLPGSTFTSPTVEGVDVLYIVTSISPNTVKVASNAVNSGTKGTVTIPSNVEGYEVTGVAKDAFSSTYYLEEIKLPATVITIDESAFNFCYAKEINIPEGIASLPNKAFYYCKNLLSMIIPASVQTIGSKAFYSCDNLAYICMESATPIDIPEDAFPTRANVTLYVPYGSKVAYEAADYWKEFKEIRELPEDMTGVLLPGSTFTSKTVEGVDVLYTVTSINPNTVKVASNAVSTGIKGSVTIPSKVEGYEVIGVEKSAFESIYGLTEITLPATITSLDEKAFYFCQAKEINIPAGVASIPNKAFYYSKITRITIPTSIQTIGSEAFYSCNALAFVFMESGTPIAIPEDAFPTRANVTLYVPYGSKDAYKAADYWKEFKEVIELPEDMTGILLPGSTFTSKTVEGVDVLYTVQSLSPLTAKVASKAVNKDTYGSVTIPANAEGYEVIGIEGSAFETAYHLTEITLPTTIISLDEKAFYFCYAKEINLPEGLTAIPKDAFRYADIIRIIIPASVQAIGNEAFYFCTKLSYVIMESAIPFAIPEDAFPTRANVTLYVPKGSKAAYQAADYWKDFKEIIELEEGDADGDGVVDVNDVTSTINYILNKPVSSFFFESADVDEDGVIDVNDVQGIIDKALGRE